MSSLSSHAGPSGYPQVPPPPDALTVAVPQRLHPAAMGVWALAGVGPVVLLIVAGTINPFVAVFLLVGGAVSSLVRWLRFTWQLESDTLIIEQGVIQRQRRVIPLERIQSVEAVRQLRHRLFGVTGLRVEAIGGNETQGQLDALTPDLAERLRRDLLRRRGSSAGASTAHADEDEASADVLASVPPGRLVVAGLTGGRVGVVAALLGFASQFFAEQVGAVLETVTGFVGAQGVQGVLLAVALFLVVVFGLSVAATTLTFWGFTLTRDHRNLYTSRGLLDQRTGTVPLHRVQTVRVQENLVRRRLGLAAVRVEVAGQPGDAAQTTSVILPIGEREAAMDLATRVIGRPELADVELTPMPQGARDRRLVRAVAAAVIATVPLVWLLEAPGLAGLVLTIPFVGLALAAYRSLGHAEPPDVMVARQGVWVRETTFTPERCLQAVAVSSTPLQRRRNLATLTLHIARSPGGGGDPELVDVAQDHARAELRRLAPIAAEAGRRRVDPEGRMVRPERPADRVAIRAVYEASGRPAQADLVDELRGSDRFDSRLSLVCELDGRVIGHVLLIEVPLEGNGAHAIHLLAAVAVHPEQTDEGVIERLVKGALASAARDGAHRVVVHSDAELYRRLRFEPASQHGVAGPPGEDGRWLVRLLPADDGTATGTVAHPAASERA